MSNSQPLYRNKTLWATVGAVIGVGALAGAAGLIYHVVEKKKKETNFEHSVASESRHLSISGQSTTSNSTSKSEYETADEMLSESEEFYDSKTEVKETSMGKSQEDSDSPESKCEKLFEKVDSLMKGDDGEKLKAFKMLSQHEEDMSDNPNFLWRYAKAYQMQAAKYGALNELEKKKAYVYKGLEHASRALKLNDRSPDAHKWFAVLTGMKADYVGVKEKIESGCTFWKHIQTALKYNSCDYSLYHLLGRFKFEVANISWFEKQVAASIVPEFPKFTYSEAINDLLKAEKMNSVPWKENKLLLARCFIGCGEYDKALPYLDSAKKIKPKSLEDNVSDKEVGLLLQKYDSYRK